MHDLVQMFMEKGLLFDEGALRFLKSSEIDEKFLAEVMHDSNTISRLADGCPIISRERLVSFLESVQKKNRLAAPTITTVPADEPRITVKKSFNEKMSEKNIGSFFDYYTDRYNALKSLLLQRHELSGAVSISRFDKNGAERKVSAIGMVTKILHAKTGNTIIEIEDPTGSIKVFVKKDKRIGEDRVVEDEVIGVLGSYSKEYFFADSIMWPDVPIPQKIKTIPEPISAVFISDLHYGSRQFLKDIEVRFLAWIRGPEAKNVKYLFIAGDVVDGVGVYPAQENDLEIKDIYKQYALFEKFVQQIPERIQVIVCPGNHDAVRSAEPQPAFGPNLLPNASRMPNVHLVSNPALVNIGAAGKEEGIDVLMYHGYSFTDIIAAIPNLRLKTAKEPQHVMKEALKKRHLAPIYGSIILSPEKKDHLVIDSVPDIFHTADLHSHAVENYKGITMISSSTFQGQTAFMDRVGHVANPGKVTVVELDTRKHYVVDLMK